MGFHRNAQRKTCSGATSRYTHTHTHTHTHTVLINTFRTDMWTKPYLLLLLLLLLYRNIPQTIHKRKARWKRHILYRNCFLKHAVEERIEWRKEVTGRRGRWCEDLRDELKEKRGYWKLKEVALNRTLWRIGFERGHGPFLSQTIDWINIGQHRCPSAWCFHVTRWAKLTDTMLYEMTKNPPHPPQKMNMEANTNISKGVVRNACIVLQLYTFTLAFRTPYPGNNHKALPVVLLLTRNSDGDHWIPECMSRKSYATASRNKNRVALNSRSRLNKSYLSSVLPHISQWYFSCKRTCTGHESTFGVEVQLHSFLTYAPGGYKWSASRLKVHFAHWIRRWLSPKASLEDLEKW